MSRKAETKAVTTADGTENVLTVEGISSTAPPTNSRSSSRSNGQSMTLICRKLRLINARVMESNNVLEQLNENIIQSNNIAIASLVNVKLWSC